MNHPITARVIAALRARAHPESARGAERYFKHAIRFHGVKTPVVLAVARSEREAIAALGVEDAIAVACELISADFMEQRQVGVQFLKQSVQRLPADFVVRLAAVFDAVVKDWGTCDAICSHVLRHLLPRHPRVRRDITRWSASSNPWRRRAAAVTFVVVARHGQHTADILAVCEGAVRTRDRFAQLGAGWVLRELYLAAPADVLRFLRHHYPQLIREGLRYAIEKMPATLQRRVLDEYAASHNSTTPRAAAPRGTGARSRRGSRPASRAAAAPRRLPNHQRKS